MKKRLVGLGLSASLFVGCGANNPELHTENRQVQTIEETEAEQKVSCVDTDRYSQRPINSSRFVIKSCEFIGQTEFYDQPGSSESKEAEISVLQFEDTISKRTLECIAISNGNSTAGIQFDCNWPAYNEPN